MKKLYTLFVVLSLIFGLSSIEAKQSKSKSRSERHVKSEKHAKSEKRSKTKTRKDGRKIDGRKVYDHEGNEWPDWGKVDL